MAETESYEVVVYAPLGRDAELCAEVLGRGGIRARTVPDPDALVEALDEGVGAALLTVEGLAGPLLVRLGGWVGEQEAWSDLPFVIFSGTRGEHPPEQQLKKLGNLRLVDRPVRLRMLISTFEAALRDRRRQYEARRAIKSRDKFLAMLGHELRNPLGALTMSAQLLGRSAAVAEGDAKRWHDTVLRQAGALRHLVDDLLDVARVTQGKISLKRSRVEVRSLIERCVEAARPQAERSLQTLEVVSGGEDELFIDADAVRVEQVVANLLGNAVKYTPRVGRIQVDVAPVDDTVEIRVRDTGVGLLPDEKLGIFEVFAQVDNSLDRSEGGLGMGLAVVKTLVELHGGSIWADSEGPGTGSVFTVRFPRAAPAAEESAPVTGARSTEARRVLLVEDNDDLRGSLAAALRALGHQVLEAADGESGLKAARNSDVEVAVVDIGLPRMNGYEVARALREAGAGEPRLIALTGYGQPEDRQRALEAGFDRHLTKPVELSTLLEAFQAEESSLG